MKKLVVLIFTAPFIVSVIANSHPFVGENANASSVKRPDGTITMRLQEKIVPFSKYDDLTDRSLNTGPQMTLVE